MDSDAEKGRGNDAKDFSDESEEEKKVDKRDEEGDSDDDLSVRTLLNKGSRLCFIGKMGQK